MNHQLITTRASLSIAGAVLLGVTIAGSSSARQDSGTMDVGTSASGRGLSQDALENHWLSPLPQPAPPEAPAPRVVIRFIDDNSLEFLQLGAGLFAGVALAGAGAVMVSRRANGHLPHPA
ncbi:hypothetical protein [Pedococcus bigeumensis]|uniref:hypothetical protein n=1 Tax=Pedococcus bigeumensis TaxID=433644 RepID=UPI001127D2CB|nr:hypothetical protein [Pedococcus bigeumensis]